MDEQVLERAIEVFGTREKAIQWFNSPIPALGGKVPAELLKTPEGAELVMNTLGRIEYGLFA
ncbi:MAG: MbcA/ParS/Xre antitoxin family protein [Oryzomonas sp.]|uniref:MbcA/ParS/Xre antitoxin family protein n=1 Tax=Oryzomonas sp. TaxID=2855186 RepID=UPI00284D9C40|nr:MbcA/ParS/Xre antitoxin family protein [Oryzomonas sp.]MDR3580517.1 MbcA/ParS/Xre antitoxin family protein [Oryzomonas sp.]